MSAWICSEKHIKILAIRSVFNDETDVTPERLAQATKNARLLWSENFKSINYRYSENRRRPNITVTAKDVAELVKIKPEVIINLAHSYDYQTCEHPTYPKSKAYRVLRELCYDASWDMVHPIPNLPWSI